MGRTRYSPSTDINTLSKQLEQRILGLGSIKSFYRADDTKAFKAATGRAQFVKDFYLCKCHVSVRLKIPFNQIDDSHTMCEDSDEEGITLLRLSSVDDLDYAMELIQQAYNYNLIK